MKRFALLCLTFVSLSAGCAVYGPRPYGRVYAPRVHVYAPVPRVVVRPSYRPWY